MSSSTSICRLLPSHWDMALPIGRIWFVCLAMILVSCGEREEERSILPDDFALCAGDVVFRRGEGITSRAVLATDANGNYSHVGIVVDYAERRMIVHAVPGEPDFEGDVDQVKMDTPEKFFSYKNASKGEVCRLRDSSIAQRASRTLHCGFSVKAHRSTISSTTRTLRRCTAQNWSFMPIVTRASI